MNRTVMMIASALALVAMAGGDALAQGRGGGRGGAPPPPPDTTSIRAPAGANAAMLDRIWAEGMDRSQAAALAQVLMDSLGPRLTGSPGMEAASRWAIAKYASWGVPARAERYGTWNAWRRGVTHLDLIAPRVRSLEAMMLAWSPGTPGGRAVEGEVVLLPDLPDSAAFGRWLSTARGKFILTGPGQLSCRSPAQWQEFGTPASIAKLAADRAALAQQWAGRVGRLSGTAALPQLPQDATPEQRAERTRTSAALTERYNTRLRDAGIAAALTMNNWSQYPGINKIFGSPSQRIPTIDVSCEDYGLLYRMAANNQGPRVRLAADAEFLGERPVFNTIAEIKGSTKPNEYVMLSAHFDSWDGSSGATDNGTGTITMMEALRILKTVLPNPTRTIVVGHWSGEEQGLNGSRAFSEDHPEIVRGLQALFNQDNGTGRIQSTGPGPVIDARPVLVGYIDQLPPRISQYLRFRPQEGQPPRDPALSPWNVGQPGAPGGGGSDHSSFQCYGAPAFSLGALGWDYSNTTWHTNRDTYDKVVIEDLKHNATLTAMLTYLASEDPRTISRANLFQSPDNPITYPTCVRATRTSGASNR